MSRLREIAAAALVCACTRTAPQPSPAREDATAPADAARVEPIDSGPADAAPPPDDTSAYLSGAPKRAKSVGHTSVVYKVELESGKKAAFRPGYAKGPIRYKGEIAAYRLAQALGIPNVPRAYPRTMPARELAAALGAPLPAEVLVSGDDVKGAIVPWIDKLDFLPIEKEPLASKWRAWMKRGAPVDDEVLARQIAAMVVFDWITGNWDRWSGGNVGFAKDFGNVLFIDNDGAFFETPPKDHLARQWKLLEGMDRFPKGLVERLRSLDADALAKAIGDEGPGTPLLSAKALAGVDERRKRLLALVDAKLDDAGASDTLSFP